MALQVSACAVAAASPVEDLADKARRGREAMAAGRFDQAAAQYAEIVQALPEHAGMRLNLGMALSMAGRPADGLRHLEAAVELEPRLLPAWLFLGTAYLELDQPESAVEPLRRVLELQPGDQDVRLRLADALLAAGRYREAARQYRAVVERSPATPRAWYGMGRSYEGLGQASLRELERTARGSPELTLLVADEMEAAGRDAEALRLYREALGARPGLGEVHEALARIYERRDQPEKAAIERQKAVSLATSECDSPGLECDYRNGRYDAVIEAARGVESTDARYWLSRAAAALARTSFSRLEQLPLSPEAVLLRVHLRRGRHQPVADSIEELREATETWPDDVRLRRELAASLLSINDAEGARRLLEELLADQPDSADFSMLLGETWLKLQRPDKAIPFLERAADRDAGLAAQAALGRAYLEIDQPEKAATALEAALETDTDGSLYYQLSRAYRAMGDDERSSRAMQEFEARRRAAEAEAGGLEEEPTTGPPR